MRRGLTAILGLLAAGAALAGERPELSAPLACEPHKTCFIQSYVDLDAGPGIRDFSCGTATYDKHTGVDFRVLSAEASKAGIPVLASAGGAVKGVRDGERDIFVSQTNREDIKGRECGNGVVLDHGDGWETQYCHMKQGSVSVSKGQSVKRGDRLGDVGYSGMAEFAHVHLSVRHNDKVIDPFLPDAVDGACQRDAKGAGMWLPAAAAAFPYKSGEILISGFAGEPPDHAALEVDHARLAPLTPASPALLFFGRFINLKAGDRVRLVVNGPGGSLVEQLSGPIDRNKATFTSYAGKKRKELPWPLGRYEGRVEIVRDGAVIAASVGTHDMR